MATKYLKGGDKLRAKMAELAQKVSQGASLQVGFLEGANYPDGTPVASVAAYNEFGTDRIPPRPFMRNTIANNQEQWGRGLATVLHNTDYNAEIALDLMGEKIAGQMQAEIRAMRDPPNAPSTIDGKGFDKPLIDTGQMLASVGHEVKET